MFFLSALHPGAVHLHPDRAEKALETFESVGRSNKGDLMQKRAEKLPQPSARDERSSVLLDVTTASFGDLSK